MIKSRWIGMGLVIAVCAACSEPAGIVIEPLRVINWSPASGAFCVGVDAVVSATFSDQLVESSVTADSFYLADADGPVETALAYDAANYTIRATPAAPLAFDRLYAVVATTALRGQAHGRLAVNLEAAFITVARAGCVPGEPECQLPSDCPGTQICARIGVCVDECVSDKDCYHATCELGTCVPVAPADGGGGDPGGGDPVPGDGD